MVPAAASVPDFAPAKVALNVAPPVKIDGETCCAAANAASSFSRRGRPVRSNDKAIGFSYPSNRASNLRELFFDRGEPLLGLRQLPLDVVVRTDDRQEPRFLRAQTGQVALGLLDRGGDFVLAPDCRVVLLEGGGETALCGLQLLDARRSLFDLLG